MMGTWWDTPCEIQMSGPDEPSWIEMHAFKSANAVFNCPLNYLKCKETVSISDELCYNVSS